MQQEEPMHVPKFEYGPDKDFLQMPIFGQRCSIPIVIDVSIPYKTFGPIACGKRQEVTLPGLHTAGKSVKLLG